MEFEPIIGLEVHAELATKSKIFCSCQVVDAALAQPNIAVCPVCSGMPGVLPVVNRRAVEYALRVALALECDISLTSIFARKNYFYPDLPKGYQISQYEQPLAQHGRLVIPTDQGEKLIRIRRVHLEEDTGKLTHLTREGQAYSLIDLNRAGVPLLEIVTEPDMRSAEEVRVYATILRSLLCYLGVNSGDMQKGVMRIEPNVSVRPVGSEKLGTRVEIKNLNSFRALERSVSYEIKRQSAALRQGRLVRQETVGWDDNREVTFTQRVKEGEEDYRYFPEPDLPPLVLDAAWVESIRAALPELPIAKQRRFETQYGLNRYETGILIAEQATADFFERTAASAVGISPKTIFNWVVGELFGLLNQLDTSIEHCPVSPEALAGLIKIVVAGEINNNTAKNVLAEMFQSGHTAGEIITAKGLQQISDGAFIAALVERVLAENPEQVEAFVNGKETIVRWLFGQVMSGAKGQANPQVLRVELERQLKMKKNKG